jgi:hypothetical protein
LALTSTSTLTNALGQLNDNLSWDGDITKATNALEAVRWLLFNRPESQGDSVRSWSYARLEEMESQLSAYIDKVGTTSSSIRSSFVRGRMAR